jgi:hypothetical protein
MSKPDPKRKKKKRTKGRARRDFSDVQTQGGGAMSKMVSGFKTAIGVGGDEKKKKSKILDRLLTLALVAVTVGVIVYRCG